MIIIKGSTIISTCIVLHHICGNYFPNEAFLDVHRCPAAALIEELDQKAEQVEEEELEITEDADGEDAAEDDDAEEEAAKEEELSRKKKLQRKKKLPKRKKMPRKEEEGAKEEVGYKAARKNAPTARSKRGKLLGGAPEDCPSKKMKIKPYSNSVGVYFLGL